MERIGRGHAGILIQVIDKMREIFTRTREADVPEQLALEIQDFIIAVSFILQIVLAFL